MDFITMAKYNVLYFCLQFPDRLFLITMLIILFILDLLYSFL